MAGSGDLWYDTDDKNKVYYWDGDGWEPVSDERIDEHATSISEHTTRISELNSALEDNETALAAAEGRLSTAETQISNAFTEIDLKPDQAYVDAAKQQAIDAANLAVNQTLVRSINTTIIANLPIVAVIIIGFAILGPGTLLDLSLALFIGTTVGAFSSVFLSLIHI